MKTQVEGPSPDLRGSTLIIGFLCYIIREAPGRIYYRRQE